MTMIEGEHSLRKVVADVLIELFFYVSLVTSDARLKVSPNASSQSLLIRARFLHGCQLNEYKYSSQAALRDSKP